MHRRHPRRWSALVAIVVSASLALAGAWAATTSGTIRGKTSVRLTVRPKKPKVDDQITVSFRIRKPPARGYRWEAQVLFMGRGVRCADYVTKSSRRRGGRGQVMRLRLRPKDSALKDEEWCEGESAVSVSHVRRNGARRTQGMTTIRFTGKPEEEEGAQEQPAGGGGH